MTPHGSDRVRVDGERVVLSSRLPKGWTARVERTLTSAEFPGTAVLWDERYFEVVEATPLPLGVRYTLEPWQEHHAMRVTARYDAESEAVLAAEWRAAHAREHKRRMTAWLAPLTGHLPAVVQERLGAELGVLPTRMTLASLLTELALLIVIVAYAVTEYMAQRGVPLWTIFASAFLFLECALRFLVVWTQSRPAGSTFGVIGYIVVWLLTGSRAETSPFERLRGHGTPIAPTPEERAGSDALLLREPLATLLPATDQWRLQHRYGFDYRRLAKKVAVTIVIVATLGVVTALASGALVTALVAALVVVEQFVRLAAFPRGPQPSILGWLVRPVMRKLL